MFRRFSQRQMSYYAPSIFSTFKQSTQQTQSTDIAEDRLQAQFKSMQKDPVLNRMKTLITEVFNDPEGSQLTEAPINSAEMARLDGETERIIRPSSSF